MNLESRIEELENLLFSQDKKIDTLLEMLEQLTGTKSDVVSTAEAALMLGVSQRTVLRLYQEGKMPKNISKGKHLRFERSAIEKMAKAKTIGRPRKAA